MTLGLAFGVDVNSHCRRGYIFLPLYDVCDGYDGPYPPLSGQYVPRAVISVIVINLSNFTSAPVSWITSSETFETTPENRAYVLNV